MPRRKTKSLSTSNLEKKLHQRVRRNALKGEERAQWLARHAEYQRERRARMTPEKLEEMRRANAARNRRRRAVLSEEDLEQLRRANRERARHRRDTVRAGLLPDSAACPEFFSSVGLRRGRRRPVEDDGDDSPRRAGEGDEHEEALGEDASPPTKRRPRAKKDEDPTQDVDPERALEKQTGREVAVHEADPSVLLSSVAVELTEERSESEDDVERTKD